MSTFDVEDGMTAGAAAPSGPQQAPAPAPARRDPASIAEAAKLLSVQLASLPAFPRAAIPVVPVMSLASFSDQGGTPVRSILDVAEKRFVTSGRIAIALALRELKIGPGDSVLVPAYHCASMIEPVIWAGATPVFYRINPDTSVQLDDIAAKIDASTRLVMSTNYFGFPQPLADIRALCDARGLAMLEDCAHSFLGEYRGKPLGSYGDYAIASSMKFFPIYEGGCLASSRHSLAAVQLRSAGKGFEAKVTLNALEGGFEYGRLGLVKLALSIPMHLKNFLWRQIKARKAAGASAAGGAGAPKGSSLAPGSSEGGFGFDPAWLDKRSSWFSRQMLRLVSRRRMGALRRRNYLTLHAAMQGMPGVHPLFPTLPEGTYPWVFPLMTDDPDSIFSVLKHAGVPVVRFGEFLWPGVDASVCPASVDLSRRVLQFPCHQELRSDELAWMINKIKEVLLAASATNK